VTPVVDSTVHRSLPASRALLPPAPRRRLVVVSGLAGAGKSELLRALAMRGEQVLELEELAGHGGSAFGGLGRPPQPSHRLFQARLAAAWLATDPARPLFVEDEGEYLGSVGLPPELSAGLRTAERVLLETPPATRIERLVRTYGGFSPSLLEAAVRRLRPRLGRERTRAALRALARGDAAGAAEVLLGYYDPAYLRRQARSGPLRGRVPDAGGDPAAAAQVVAALFERRCAAVPAR